jgi:hypothetical protein
MPATRRSSRFPRAVAVLIPLSAALGGCVAALPLLQLGAATPMPQAAPCAQNAQGTQGTPDRTTPACNAGATGSTMPGMATLMQVLAPATAQSH